MKPLFVALIIVAGMLCVDAKRPHHTELNDGYTFDRYLKDFSKSYSCPKEHALRKSLFDARLKEINTHNFVGPKKSYTKGVNHLTDTTPAERKAMGGTVLNQGQSKAQKVHKYKGKQDLIGLPPTVDYRLASPPILTTVKDQGFCGSCWAHSAVESIESYHAMATGELFVLSQEQINACTPDPGQCGGTGGCGGNIYELGWDYVVSAGGIAQEWTYPYESYFGTTGTCYQFPVPNATNHSRKFMPVASISGYTKVEPNNQDALLHALATVGPLSISLDASHWFEYEGGVFTDCHYSKNITIDHGVQLVGYGHDYTIDMDYWIVRNSWNAGFGEAGFIRLQRHNGTEYCGWNKLNDYDGIGCKGQPNTTWTCGMCGLAADANYVNTN